MLLVDTGEVLTGVDVFELRLLKQFLIQYPMMAVKMRLSGVEMPDSREWSKEVTDYFNELSHCDAPVRVSVDSRVVSQHEAATAKAYAVTAYVIRDDHDLCINADLVNKKLAKLQDPSGPHYRTVRYYHSKPKHCATADGDLDQVLGGCFAGKVIGVAGPNSVYFMFDHGEEGAEDKEEGDALHELQVQYTRQQ